MKERLKFLTPEQIIYIDTRADKAAKTFALVLLGSALALGFALGFVSGFWLK